MNIHIAIMKKSWGLTQKILNGKKTIESRWYLNKVRPWGNISKGDVIYFKDTGSPVSVMAEVSKVLAFENLTPRKVRQLLNQYALNDGLGVEKSHLERYYDQFKHKRYCILIFLKNPRKVKPFDIDKTGFGGMSAWITVDKLERIKV